MRSLSSLACLSLCGQVAFAAIAIKDVTVRRNLRSTPASGNGNNKKHRRRLQFELVVDVQVDMNSSEVTFDSSWNDFVVIEHLDEDWDAAAANATAGGGRRRKLQDAGSDDAPQRPVASLDMKVRADHSSLLFDIIGGALTQPDEQQDDMDPNMLFTVNVNEGGVPMWVIGMEYDFGNENNDEVDVQGTCQREHGGGDAGSVIPFDLSIVGATKASDQASEVCYEHVPTGIDGDDEHYEDCLTRAQMAIRASQEVNGFTNIQEWELQVGFEHKFIAPAAEGDPHFMTWSGEKYDFHGECDLVLIDHPTFDQGAGMHVHARTRLMRHGVGRDRWSRIDSLAIKIGNNKLEMHGESQQHWINGEADVPLPAMIGGYEVREVPAPLAVMKRYVVDLGNGEKMWIKIFKEFVYFELEGSRADTFSGAYGLFGEYITGHKVARDHKTIIEDPYEFGQEWQVRPKKDVRVFRNRKGVQHPHQCILPKKGMRSVDDGPSSEQDVSVKRRRLGGGVTDKQAREACADVDHWTRDECVFDVMATGDLDMAVAYLKDL